MSRRNEQRKENIVMNIEVMSSKILKALFIDFRDRGLTIIALNDGYVGPKLIEFKKSLGISDNTSQRAITFDISLNNLEEAKLVDFGPLEAYENDSNTNVVILGSNNKKEYIWLTEKGYKYYLENRGKNHKKSIYSQTSRQGIKIHDSIVLQSQIGTTSQNIENTIKITDDKEVINYLHKLLEQTGKKITDDDKKELKELVEAVNEGGNIRSIKKTFNKLFGYAKNGVSQVAWNLISTIIANQIGMR